MGGKRFAAFASVGIVFAALISACGQKSEVQKSFDQVTLPLAGVSSIIPDPGVSQETIELLKQDLLILKGVSKTIPSQRHVILEKATLRAPASEEESAKTIKLTTLGFLFEKIFRDDLMQFLESRISYVLPPNPPKTTEVSESQKIVTNASNVGTQIFFQAQMYPERELRTRFGGVDLPRVRHSGVGLIQLGNGFQAGRYHSVFARMGILIHEARHSDCVDPIRGEDVQRMIRGVSEEIQDKTCGHFHVKCTQGLLEGVEGACDGHQWGAYAIEFLLHSNISQFCDSCESSEKAISAAIALEMATRLNLGTEYIWNRELPRYADQQGSLEGVAEFRSDLRRFFSERSSNSNRTGLEMFVF